MFSRVMVSAKLALINKRNVQSPIPSTRTYIRLQCPSKRKSKALLPTVGQTQSPQCLHPSHRIQVIPQCSQNRLIFRILHSALTSTSLMTLILMNDDLGGGMVPKENELPWYLKSLLMILGGKVANNKFGMVEGKSERISDIISHCH